jgi:hypothetical protein
MVPGVGVEPSRGLILRKLLILRNSKREKNHKNAEVRYTAGKRHTPTLHDPLLLPRTAKLRSSFTRGDRAFKL